MTPQQLIDMRGAGSAEKWLRKNGKWRLTPTEKLMGIICNLDDAADDVRTYCDDAIKAMEKQASGRR